MWQPSQDVSLLPWHLATNLSMWPPPIQHQESAGFGNTIPTLAGVGITQSTVGIKVGINQQLLIHILANNL
ncbi:MAG: hypothetical protein P4L50_04665 [Anaerolineaceae bacterium]|nr:hypothetical protein [Anaerolineaceae bacterium]